MKKFFTKFTCTALLVVFAYSMTGCYGTFSLTSKLHQWNGNATGSKFGNECVFLALCIIPVYELCTFGDALIFNSIEFWGGNNPIAMNEGEFEEMNLTHNGKMYRVTKSHNYLNIACGDESETFRYFSKERAWYQMNGEEKVKVVEMKADEVFTYLPNGETLSFNQSNINNMEAEIMAAR